MAWTSPLTWVAGQIVTAANLNTHLRDQLRFLRGLDGVATVDSGLIIDSTDGDEYFRLPALTTSETTSTLTTEANVAYDETLHKIKYRSSGSNEVVLARDDVDDVAVDGASTVPISSNWAYDHLNILTTSGDIPIATGAGTWTRLAKTTVGLFLKVNSASAVVWGGAPNFGTAGTRSASINTIYQNTTGNPMMVTIVARAPATGGGCTVKCDSASNPATQVGGFYSYAAESFEDGSITFIAEPDYYYTASIAGASCTIIAWREWY